MYYELLSNSDWYFLPDPDNVGVQKRWMEQIPDAATRIAVPSCVEETFPGVNGVLWYWKRFHARDLPEDHHYRIRFEGVDYFAEGWLNGIYLGGAESGLLPFAFEVGRALREGENLLAVRVIDPIYGRTIEGYQLGSIPGGRQHEDPWTPGEFSYNYGGILQDVVLDGRSLQWIADVFVRPNVEDSSVEVHIELDDRTGPDETFLLEVSVQPDFPEPEDVIARARKTIRLAGGRRHVLVNLFLPKMVLWEVHNAFLYRLTVTLMRGRDVLDRWTDRFGMRTFGFRDGRVTVNGRPILLRGFLYNQIWPVTLGRPFENMAYRDIELAKEAGANLLRTFSKSPFRETLNACDELGMLVQVETLAAWHLTEGPRAPRAQRLEELILRQVRRDRNRACVLWWCCLSDTAGELLDYVTHQVMPKVRALDPTRMVLNADNASPEGVVQWLPSEPAPQQHFQTRHEYLLQNVSLCAPVGHSQTANLLAQIDEIRGRAFQRRPAPDAPALYLSEWGVPHGSQWGVLMENYARYPQDLEDAKLFRELVEHHREQYSLLRLEERGFPTFDAFLTAGKRAAAKRYEEYLTMLWGNPRAVGHCLKSLEDSGYEISGVVDIWRNAKAGTYQKIREMNARLQLVVDWQPRTLYIEQPLNLDVALVNEHELEPGEYILDISLHGPHQTVVWEVSEPVTLTGELIQLLFQRSMGGAPLGATYRLSVSLRARSAQPGESLVAHARNVQVFERIPKRHYDFKIPYVWNDQEMRLSKFLASLGVPHEFIERVDDVPRQTPLFVAKDRLEPEEMPIWQAILARCAEGSPLVVLDHRFFAEGNDPVAHFPEMAGWKPDPHLIAWDYGGCRFITNHALFSGLPRGCSIGSTDIYARLCPVDSWQVHNRPKPVACDVAAFHANIERRDPYTVDLCTLEYGGVRMVITTFNLMANVGDDPATDRLILNILEYVSRM